MASLERNVSRCLLYSEDGQVEEPTLEVSTSKAEPIRDWAEKMFDSVEGNGDWQRRRERFLDAMPGDVARQSFREIPLEQALPLL